MKLKIYSTKWPYTIQQHTVKSTVWLKRFKHATKNELWTNDNGDAVLLWLTHWPTICLSGPCWRNRSNTGDRPWWCLIQHCDCYWIMSLLMMMMMLKQHDSWWEFRMRIFPSRGRIFRYHQCHHPLLRDRIDVDGAIVCRWLAPYCYLLIVILDACEMAGWLAGYIMGSFFWVDRCTMDVVVALLLVIAPVNVSSLFLSTKGWTWICYWAPLCVYESLNGCDFSTIKVGIGSSTQQANAMNDDEWMNDALRAVVQYLAFRPQPHL